MADFVLPIDIADIWESVTFKIYRRSALLVAPAPSFLQMKVPQLAAEGAS